MRPPLEARPLLSLPAGAGIRCLAVISFYEGLSRTSTLSAWLSMN